jgi:hypothetical protein
MAGTVVLTSQYNLGNVRAAVITLTADAAAATFPATTLASLGLSISGTILEASANPGATAPTDGYSVTLLDADGLDRFRGALVDLDTANSERRPVWSLIAAGEPATVTATGNAVNSAVVVLTIRWTPTAEMGASRMVRVPAAPSVDTAALAIADVMSTAIIEFPNCATAPGGSGYIEKLTILNRDHAAANFLACELQLFSATVTPAAANAAHVLSDADAALHIGNIPMGLVTDMGANNSMAVAKGLNLAFVLVGTSIFGILVARAAVTYTSATALVPALVISQNP